MEKLAAAEQTFADTLPPLEASLDLAPNAIYRYFSARPALEAALANEAARQLELALSKAADGREPVTIKTISLCFCLRCEL